MPIRYKIHENSLPNRPGSHMAHVEPTYVADLEDIIERIVGHGTTVSRSDLYSALTDFTGAVEEMLREGIFVRTALVNYHVGVRGVFDGPEDGFDPSRHQVIPQTIPSRRLRRMLQDHAQVVKLGPTRRRPVVARYVDVNSGTANQTVTPCGAGRLVGQQLKYDPADRRQGVFFVAAGGAETRVELAARNMPREVIFVVPALEPGPYVLQVRVAFEGNEDIQVSRLEEELTVPA